MAVSDSDLFYYGAANMPTADGATVGGAIDLTKRVVWDSHTLAGTLQDTVEVVSSAAGDTTQTVTIYGRNAAGALISEVINLNGTTVANGATTFERVYRVVVSASHTGTITVRKATGDTTIVALATGLLDVQRLFYNVAADVSGGSERIYYCKFFCKNTHASLSLLAATVSEITDSQAQLELALETSVNGSGTSTNRQTAPASGVGSFGAGPHSLPGDGNLDAGEAIGIWAKLTLPAGDTATNTTYAFRVSGSSA